MTGTLVEIIHTEKDIDDLQDRINDFLTGGTEKYTVNLVDLKYTQSLIEFCMIHTAVIVYTLVTREKAEEDRQWSSIPSMFR